MVVLRKSGHKRRSPSLSISTGGFVTLTNPAATGKNFLRTNVVKFVPVG